MTAQTGSFAVSDRDGTGRCYVCGSPGVLLHDGVVNWLTPGGLTYSFSRCENPACGHAWLRAPSSSEAVDAYPANYYTHQPAPTGPVARSVARAKRSRLGHALGYVMYLQDMTPGRVLEVGCGSGARLAELRGMGWEVRGIEPDATAAAIARDYYHLPVLVTTLEQGTFPPASFDAVVMTHVIEHVPDPLPLLRACRTVLSPGGKLVVTCPNIDAYGHRRYGASWTALDPPRHEHLFTRASLMALARAAGFTSVEARTSIRGAWGNFVGSERLRATGRRGGGSAALRAKGLALVAYELFRLAGDPLAGEEIAMVCTR